MITRILYALFLALSLCGCSNGSYYLQMANGHMQIINKRQPIRQLIAAQETPADLRERLAEITAIRDFASQRLSLPDNGSYRSYVKLDRPYVLWNLVAAPEFSLTPHQWCFPIIGCVNYRGYFDPQQAETYAKQLDTDRFDTAVIGVPAYSTLSWFDDPVLSTFSDWPLPSIAKLIFHELAHQKLYLSGDSEFNESFATAVEQIGVELWLQERGDPQLTSSYHQQFERQEQFHNLLDNIQKELEALYASGRPAAEMRRDKAKIFAQLRQRYAELRDSWQGYNGYDGWFEQVNNARIAAVATYHRWVPAFKQAYQASNRNLNLFYDQCQKLAELNEGPRQRQLEALKTGAEKDYAWRSTEAR